MSITSANAVYQLSVTSLFPTPVQLQGFSADDVFNTDPIDSAEISMGVDGRLSAGFIHVPIKQSIMLQADSASCDIFDSWYAAEQSAQEKFFASATVLLSSIGKQWSMTNGVLTSYAPIPDAKKILQPRKFEITWERMSPAVSF